MNPRHLTDHARLPADAGAHQQGDTVLLQLHDLDHVGAERLADQPAGLVQNLVQVVGPESKFSEPRNGIPLQEGRTLAVRSYSGHSYSLKNAT